MKKNCIFNRMNQTKKYYNLIKSVMWDCWFFLISDISYIYSISDTFFFAFCVRHLESQINMYVKGYHIYKHIWTPEIGESLDAQIEPNNPADKYAVCIRKSGKVVGHLKKGETGRFGKTIIFFPESWSLFESKNNNIWAQMQSWWWWRFVGPL